MYKLILRIPLFLILALTLNARLAIAQNKDDDSKCSMLLMETLSSLAASNLFQIYMSVTIMNDNVDNTQNYEIFDEALFTLEKQLKTMSNLFDKFNKSKFLTKDDFEYIFQLKNINFLLREDIKLFREFLSDNDDRTYKSFFLKHTEVYKKLEEIIVIEDIDGNGGDNNEQE